MNHVGIHVNIIRHTEMWKYEKCGLNSNRWTIWATNLFYQKRLYVSFYEGVHYRATHTFNTNGVIDASRLIMKFDHCQCGF